MRLDGLLSRMFFYTIFFYNSPNFTMSTHILVHHILAWPIMEGRYQEPPTANCYTANTLKGQIQIKATPHFWDVSSSHLSPKQKPLWPPNEEGAEASSRISCHLGGSGSSFTLGPHPYSLISNPSS